MSTNLNLFSIEMVHIHEYTYTYMHACAFHTCNIIMLLIIWLPLALIPNVVKNTE